MPIFLDQQTRPYLESLIQKQVERNSYDFIAKRLEGILQADSDRLEEIANCDHEFGKYIGNKECCTKCGGMAEGMGESWALGIREQNRISKGHFASPELKTGEDGDQGSDEG
jgi:hypothetical protein